MNFSGDFIGLSGQVFLDDEIASDYTIDPENFSGRDALEVMKEQTEVMKFYQDYHQNMQEVKDYSWVASAEKEAEGNEWVVLVRESGMESPFLCKARINEETQKVVESVCGHEQEGRPLNFPSEFQNPHIVE